MSPGHRSRRLSILLAACAGMAGTSATADFAAAQQASPPPPSAASPAPATPAPSPVVAPPTPTPALSPAPPGVPKSTPPPPTPPGSEQDALINSLNPGELQEAVNLLRANYVRPDEVDDRAIARATLDGLLGRLDHGAMLLPKPGGNPAPPADRLPDAFASEVVDDRTGYVRFGALTRDHLGDLDKALKDFADKKLPSLVFDLRATTSSSDYELATEVIRRFVAKGKPLFTLRKPSNNQERLFTSNGDPAFGGTIFLAVDADTAGAAETIAAVIRNYDHALVIGERTAGQAVEYADLRLSGGTLLRVAVSQVVLPANLSIFPDGLKPDLPAKTPHADKVAVFVQSQGKSIAPFVFETERLRFNEAALVSGVNPEFDVARDRQAAQRRGEPTPKPPLRDPVLQRAFDMATAITTTGAVKPPEAH